MEYELTAELAAPVGAPELDALQRLGVATLLDEHLDMLAGMEGPDGVEVEPIDHRITAHPGGASLAWVLDAPALAFAEDAARAVLTDLLERTELLAEWSVQRCEVTASDDLLATAVHGLDEVEITGSTGDTDDGEVSVEDIERRRASLLASAEQLRALGLDAFGHDAQGKVTEEQALFAGGALMQGVEILTDELFADIQTLHESGLPVAENDALWILDELPERHANRYTELFAKQFLVATAVLGYRLALEEWTESLSTAEALALRLAKSKALAQLDLAGLLDELPADDMFAAFDAIAFPDTEHEVLYDPSGDGGPAVEEWFHPHQHPYLADDQPDEE